MGIGSFLGDIGNDIKHGLDKTVEGLNVVDRYINPFHEEQTITPEGERRAEAALASGKSQPRGALSPGLEDAMHGMRWLYSNAVSQPIATASMVGKMDPEGGWGGDYFNPRAWDRAWKAAEHVSWGQAVAMTPEEVDHAINSPLLYYKPQEAYLPPGFSQLPDAQQQEILQEAGMPAIGNAYIEKKRGQSAWFKYGTGAIDFAGVMFLDPTIVAGGLVGKAVKATTQIKAPKGGWTSTDIENIMGQKRVQSLMSAVWKNKENSQLLMNTELARRSGMGGPKFAAIVSRLQSEEELGLFMRVGMGDGRALEDLTAQNAQINAVLRGDWSRLQALDLMRSRYDKFPNVQAMVENEMAKVAERYATQSDLMLRYDEIIKNQGLLDQLHVSRWEMQNAETRTIAQNQYLAGPARGAVSGVMHGQRRGVTIRPSIPALTVTGRGFTPRVIESGIVHSRLWGVGDFFTGPMTLIRSVKNAHPNGFIRLDTLDRDSINELRGHVARIPGIKEQTRQNIINKYIQATTEHQRKDILEDVGRLGAAKVAARYGVSPQVGVDLWRKHVALQQGEVAKMRERYTAALDPERVGASGQPLHLDELTETGGKTTLTPFTATRLMNGHALQDLDELGKVIARHGSRFETLRRTAGGSRDWVENAADYTTYLWKFTTLFRLGYIPRVLGDDLASQVASLGAAVMALRTAKGVKNSFENASRWIARPALQAREQNALNGADYAFQEARALKPQVRSLEGRLKAEEASNARELALARVRNQKAQQKLGGVDPGDLSPKALAVRNFAAQRSAQLNAAELRVSAGPSPGKTAAVVRMKDRHDFLMRYHDLSVRAAEDYRAGQQKVIQGSQSVKVDDFDFPAAFAGRSGKYALEQISADASVGNIFATNRQLVRGNLERSFDHGGTSISAMQDEVAHLEAWTHAVNNVIMQDALSKMAVKGKTIEEMTTWLKADPLGRAYRARLPKRVPEEEFARSAKYEVDQYLHAPEIRMKALEPDGVDAAFLKKAVPHPVDRPDVHTGQIGLSQLEHMNAVDRVIDNFYKYAVSLPADRLARHPLFNQLYTGHIKRMGQQAKKQGYEPSRMTVEQVEQMAHNARQLAVRDTRALVFDISHRSDAAAALRFLSPFFSATAESFQRWGRVIADKPQVAGYMANWFNAPAYNGSMQDMDGNHIDDQGYTYIPQYPIAPDGSPDYSKKPTVIKRRVPKAERYIVTRMPGWVVQSPLGYALNIRESEGQLMLSQNSMNIITQGDPWYNPGVGPIVQIPVNEFVKDKPNLAKEAREASILPFGVQGGTLLGDNPFGRALTTLTPIALRNVITSYDTTDERYQRVKMQIMNRAIYEHDVLDKPMPSAQQIADRVRNYYLFAAVASFVQPMATQRKDPYQFYYDQYRILRNQNPKTADDEFLKRYEESLFVFASEITESQGIPPTTAAIKGLKQWGPLIEKHPDLAPLLIGPEGRGPFSLEAYQYELNNPLVPGGAEMMRSKISAEEALTENRRRLGWAKFTARMNDLGARLRKSGFTSFEDEGAEDFKAEKKAWTEVYANPLKPDGSANPHYNAEWAEDYNTYNPKKYDALIPALMDIVASPLVRQSRRSDLRQLKQYLGGRMMLVRQLEELKSAGLPHTLDAEANADLRGQWAYFVDGLIEQSPSFGDLHSRYLSRDMGVDLEEVTE